MSLDEKNIDNESLDNLLDDDILSEGEGAVSLDKLKKKKFKLDKKNKLLIGITVFILIIYSFIYGVSYFFKLTLSNSTKSDFDKLFLTSVKEYILPYISDITINSRNGFIQSTDINSSLINIDQYVNDKSVPFYEKKENKEKYLQKTVSDINSFIRSIRNNQQLIAKYRYLPKELSDVLNNSQLMPILITLSAIRIYLADYVFIKLGDFNDKIIDKALKKSNFLRNISGIKVKDLRSYISEDINKFREEGVSIYLKDILFNYMYDKNNPNITNSIFINDFKNRFNKQLKYRFNNIKDTYSYIDLNKYSFINEYVLLLGNIYLETNKLYENKLLIDLLPVNIQLLSYDPKKQELSFSIKLLLSKDSKQKISIISLSSNIIYLLRESRLIIGKNIIQKTLKVNKVVKKIAGEKQYYDNINLSFTTSVQSNVNVEVSDIDK